MNTSFLWALAISVAGAAGIFLGIKRMRSEGSSIGTTPLPVAVTNPGSPAVDAR